jgi:hypothetical protein
VEKTMKDINKRKIRAHHRIIAMLKEYAPKPMKIELLFNRFNADPTAVNMLQRPNAWVTYANKNEQSNIVMATRGLEGQTYTLLNAFAFTDEGRRIGNAEGTRLLTDTEILAMLTNDQLPLVVAGIAKELSRKEKVAPDIDIILAETLFPEVVVDVNISDNFPLDSSPEPAPFVGEPEAIAIVDPPIEKVDKPKRERDARGHFLKRA